jgi:hypothetical protein
MARPKKNTQERTEFNYEDDDAEYQKTMLSTPQTSSVVYTPETIDTTSLPEISSSTPASNQVVSSIYFVEGKIRLDQDGGGPIFSDQRRIVNASNVDEAIQKFANYFVGMSNPVQRYTVVTVAASETIL